MENLKVDLSVADAAFAGAVDATSLTRARVDITEGGHFVVKDTRFE